VPAGAVKLLEYQGKAVLTQYGIPVPRGTLLSDRDALKSLDYPVALKAQVLAGGRGKAGGIRVVGDLREAQAAFDAILGLPIGGYVTKQVYAEERLDIAQELYLSLTIDRAARAPLLMASRAGGVDIESLPESEMFREPIPPSLGILPYLHRAMRRQLRLEKEVAAQVESVAAKAYTLFRGEDAELVEINPLAVLKDGRVVAADAKVTIDDSALYRQKEHEGVDQDRTPLEQEAHEKGITFLQLDGDIGVIANGAGLTMATLDVLGLKGGRGGTFLDLGGTDDPEKVRQAFLLLVKARPRVILMNIFGGITKCDTVATGVEQAMKEQPTPVPVVARIKGVNEAEAKRILSDGGMHPADTLEQAAEMAVKLRGSSG
jgi:succinyl-CoA synthetase beta subunit